MKALIDELFQERVAGTLIGDVFQAGEDDIFTLNVAADGGLEKEGGMLSVEIDPVGGLRSGADGVSIFPAANGGLDTAATGIYMNVDAKGDILVGTGDNSVERLPIGTADYVLSVGGAGATGLRWVNTGLYTNAIRTVVTDYVVVATDYLVICNKATAMTVTLPAATASGKSYKIKNINEGTVTVDGNAADTIDGELTQDLAQWDCMAITDYAVGLWVIV